MTHAIRSLAILLASVTVSVLSNTSYAENLSLARRFAESNAGESLLGSSKWHPFPRADERAPWESLPADARDKVMALGEEYAAKDIPCLPATLYLEFRRVGNRSRFQDVWFERRAMLNGLALAECVEGKGRFLDPLANLAWAICEESSWTLPAHISRQKAGVDLPDTTEPIVALFSAETASSLAWVVYLLEDQLNGVSPQISQRIRREIDQRVLTPYLQRDDFSWMGFTSNHRPNNWNPWINSNVLAATLLLEPDEARRLELVRKVLRSVDRFFVPHPSDGSCDEGPSYWGRAGASLFENLELLHNATQGRFDVYDDPVVQEMGRYIYRMHIAGEVFVCVGDCDVIANPPRDLVHQYGQRIGDPQMQDLAASGQVGAELWREPRGPWSIMRILPALFNLSKLRSTEVSPPLVRDVWLGDTDLQLMVARDKAGTTDGLFVAAWGGHNGQSHNHNDVGNFIVYQDGHPVLIDVGRPTYTRQTFSRDRYKIWAMQSAYHNLPTVNGQMQGVGTRYNAADVTYEANDSLAELKMNLAPAYPKSTGIQSWFRTVQLTRGNSVQITDDFALSAPSSDIAQHLMTPCDVEVLAEGRLRLSDKSTGAHTLVGYTPPGLHVDIETIELEDAKLAEMWGPRLRRISFRAAKPVKQAAWGVLISAAE
jgi:heparinase II/III-like protein